MAPLFNLNLSRSSSQVKVIGQSSSHRKEDTSLTQFTRWICTLLAVSGE